MAEIAVSPFVLQDSIFKVAADDYASGVSAVQIDPTTPQLVWKGMKKGSAFRKNGSAEWACTIAYAQDWETANSFSRYLLAHEGETVEVEFHPESGGIGFAVTLVIAPGAIGGTVDTVAVGSVTLGVQGAPVEIPAPAPAPGA